MKINFKLSLLTILVALTAADANAVLWVKTFDGSTTYGKTGTITLDDWGFTGPQGRLADSFEPYGGVFGNGTYDTMGAAFCINDPVACEVGQRQHVITRGPDGITPDAPALILDDWAPNTGDFENANVDSLTTFFFWGYTSGAGSTFSDMMIDFDGDYRIAKDDMAFTWYNIMDYEQVIPEGGVRIGDVPDSDPNATPPIVYYNSLGFQAYAVSDATGWCGSVMASHPNAHEAMAGQVTFGLIMDVYFVNPDGTPGSYSSSEYTPDFEMRSFGDITLDFSDGQHMSARAVVNNTDASVDNQTVGPDTPTGDIDLWHNKVSFMGSDMLESTSWCGIESAQWLSGARGIGVKRFEDVRRDITTQADCTTAGGLWKTNTFVGFGYILRADAERFIDYVDPIYGPDPMTLDTDSDGVMDYADNCTVHANATQLDTDADGYGNICDADFNNDNFVNSLDLGLFKQMYFSTGNVEADLNGDGIVNSLDLGLFKARFFQVPGPSAIAN